MKRRWMLALTVLVAMPPAGAAQDYMLDTGKDLYGWDSREFWDGGLNEYGADFVDGVLAGRGAYGQSFTLFVGSTLKSISMTQFGCFYDVGNRSYPVPGPVPGDCNFRMFIQEWEDLSRTTGRRGEILWEGPEPSGSSTTVHPNIWLEPGKYLAYLLPPATPPVPGYTGRLRSYYVLQGYYGGSSGPFSGGELVYVPNPGSADAQDPATQWTRAYSTDVAHFRAQLTTTPEPASMALLATGLAGVVGAARRRRRREAAAAGE
jgi:hypothetical protein